MRELNFDTHFKDLFENTGDLVHFIDLNGKILLVNKSWLQNLGYEIDEVQNKEIYDFIHPDHRELYRYNRKQIIENRSQKEIEFIFIHKCGHEIIVEGQIGCGVDPQFNAIYSRGVLRNVTVKKIAEKELIRNQSRLNSFLNNAPSAVIIINQEQIVLEWNPKSEEIFGFKETEVLGKSLANLIIPEQFRKAHAMGMKHFLVTGEGPVLNKTIEITALHKNEYEFSISLNISAVCINDEWLFIAFISDITQQKLMQEDIVLKKAQILQSKLLDDKKDEFMTLASHELKTPLTSLKAYMQILHKVVDQTESFFHFIEKAGTHITRLENIVSDLLDVSKIKAGEVVYSFTNFRFDESLKEVVEIFQHTCPSHQITLKIPGAAIVIQGDRVRLEQIIYNFLTNAVKYSPDAGKVIIRTEVSVSHLIISITDFGIGISNEYLENLAKRYYRVDNHSVNFNGLGTGLYIAAEILRRHGGNFRVKSELGKGSVFYITIPLVQKAIKAVDVQRLNKKTT